MSLTAHFFGTRGSLPGASLAPALQERLARALVAAQGKSFADVAAARAFVATKLPEGIRETYGSNSTCVAVWAPGVMAPLLLDAGTGLRDAGLRPRHFTEQHLLLSHLHWDHIQGLPFYEPLFDPDFHLVIHTCHPQAEQALRTQMSEPFFPLGLDQLPGRITVEVHEDQEMFEAGGFLVYASKQCHPGDSYGYRICRNDRVVVFSTDAGRKDFGRCVNCKCPHLFSAADLLIYDAMLSEEEEQGAKRDWGHSSNVSAVRFGALCKVRQLVLTHHSPKNDDAKLDAIYAETLALAEEKRAAQKWPPQVLERIWMARDGLEITI